MAKRGGYRFVLCISAALFLSPLTPSQGAEGSEKGESAKEEGKEKKSELVDRIRQVLRYGHSVQVRDALKKVKTLTEEEQKSLIPELEALIKKDDPLIRIAIAEMVGALSWNDLDDAILEFLESEDYQVVLTTLNAVRKKKIEAAQEYINKYLLEADYSENKRETTEFLSVAATYHSEEIAGHIFDKLKDEDTLHDYKLFMLSFFAGYEAIDPEALQYIDEMFTNEELSFSLRRRAIYVLGKQNHYASVDKMKGELDEIASWTDVDKKAKYSDYRNALITALIMLGDEDVAEILVEMARDDNDSVRYKAVVQLGQLRDPRFRELLEYKSKHDSNLKIQRAAGEALKKLDDKEAGDDFVEESPENPPDEASEEAQEGAKGDAQEAEDD